MAPQLPDPAALSLAEQVAQMVVVRASGHLFDPQIEYPAWEPPTATLRHWVQDLGVGGVILLGGTAAELGLRSHQLQDWATLPLLIAADIEEGVGQRFAGATWFPPPMALSAIARQDLPAALHLAQQMGHFTAQEAQAIGINWVLAPVVDVNNNPRNPVINIRAWGETPTLVSQLAIAFIQGAQAFPVLTTAKHFPGHGDTAVDSHLELPVLPHSSQRLKEIEIPPFQAAIAAGVDAVMTAHLQIPTWDTDHPATLSHPILTQELRQKLGFTGLIVTDALIMGAITNRYGTDAAAVLAVEAGADVLLMPADPAATIRAVCEAVEAGRISPERILASVERIWRAKHQVYSPPVEGGTSHAWETVPPPPIQLNHLAEPEAIATVDTILQQSMQVHMPPARRLHPVSPSQPTRNLIVLDDRLNVSFLGRQAPAIALPAERGYRLQLIDCHTPPVPLEPDAAPHQPTLLQLFIRGNPFRSNAQLLQAAQDWLRFLVQTNQLLAVVIYGSPYALDSMLPELPADLPYVFTYGQMQAAQAIALQTLFSNTENAAQLSTTGERVFTD